MSQEGALRAIRNHFYLGLHTTVVNETKANKALGPAGDVFYYRSLIALGQEKRVIAEVTNAASPDVQAVKLYATYKLASDGNRELVLEQLKALQNPSVTQQLMAAVIYFDAKNYKEALKLIHQSRDNLELYVALSIWCCPNTFTHILRFVVSGWR
jgi:hypothetical protein